MQTEIIILWTFRLGLLLLLIGVLFPSRQKRTILSKIFHNANRNYEDRGKFLNYIDKLTEATAFRRFMLEIDSDEYQKVDRLIMRAGLEKSLDANMIQLFKIILPPISFVVVLGGYLLNIASKTINLNSTIIEDIMNKELVSDLVQQQSAISIETSAFGSVNPVVIMWILVLSLVLFKFPELVLRRKIKSRKEQVKKELPVIETFIIIMLETGSNTVYEVLKTLLATTIFFKPYFAVCLNEYHIDPKKALQNMADKVNDEEFQIICNGLKQAVDEDKKYTASFMRQHIEQIKKVQDLKREADIKKKPMIYVLLLAMPLISVIVIWFYPWFVQAVNMLTSGF